MTIRSARLVLADGEVFVGEAIGAEPADGVATGEVVFNTSLTGYQEIITDPSYAGQIISFTYPHIGNYGACAADDEAPQAACRGIVVRDLARRSSSWRAERSLDEMLVDAGVPGIAGIDTRRLTRHIRDHGAVVGAFGTAEEGVLRDAASSAPGTDGIDLAATVTCAAPWTAGRAAGAPDRRIVAIDLGMKRSIVEHLRRLGDIEIVPASTSAADVLALAPDGVFLSNGPGDPAAVVGVAGALDGLLGEVPVFGICLGHQILATALGATTYKLPFGHHGGNHPVRRLAGGPIEITSQNHSYAVADDAIDAEVTHRNLNDGVIEGIAATTIDAFSVQYHPEASPGPHDATYLFDQFAAVIDARRR